MALVRYEKRSVDPTPHNAVEAWLDEHYGDGKMEKIYPNAKKA